MITHAPGPFERMIRRMCDNIGDWLDRRAVRELVAQGHVSCPAPLIARRTELEPVRDVMPQVAHPNKTKPSRVARKPAKRPAQTSEKKVVDSIVRAIAEGRASGSQREIARSYNVGRTTVQRAQRMARELVAAH